MSARHRLYLALGGLVAALCIALAVTPNQWMSAEFVSNLLAGLLVLVIELAIVVFIVDKLIEIRENVKWDGTRKRFIDDFVLRAAQFPNRVVMVVIELENVLNLMPAHDQELGALPSLDFDFRMANISLRGVQLHVVQMRQAVQTLAVAMTPSMLDHSTSVLFSADAISDNLRDFSRCCRNCRTVSSTTSSQVDFFRQELKKHSTAMLEKVASLASEAPEPSKRHTKSTLVEQCRSNFDEVLPIVDRQLLRCRACFPVEVCASSGRPTPD
jgi:hypothetical protein